MSKEFTYAEVQAHSTKKDLYVVIHDKVYDTTSFIDEHPYVPVSFECLPQRTGQISTVLPHPFADPDKTPTNPPSSLQGTATLVLYTITPSNP
jgi:hypothetical protein